MTVKKIKVQNFNNVFMTTWIKIWTANFLGVMIHPMVNKFIIGGLNWP